MQLRGCTTGTSSKRRLPGRPPTLARQAPKKASRIHRSGLRVYTAESTHAATEDRGNRSISKADGEQLRSPPEKEWGRARHSAHGVPVQKRDTSGSVSVIPGQRARVDHPWPTRDLS